MEICDIGGKVPEEWSVLLRPKLCAFKAAVCDMISFLCSSILCCLRVCSNSSGSRRLWGRQSICEIRGSLEVSISGKFRMETGLPWTLCVSVEGLPDHSYLDSSDTVSNWAIPQKRGFFEAITKQVYFNLLPQFWQFSKHLPPLYLISMATLTGNQTIIFFVSFVRIPEGEFERLLLLIQKDRFDQAKDDRFSPTSSRAPKKIRNKGNRKPFMYVSARVWFV